jgi:flagellar hook-associated protein 1 FlgK
MSFFPQGAFFGLGLMGKSLSAFQYAENITADNIANVNTPGASKQQVVLDQAPPIVGSTGYATHVLGTAGDGVLVQQVARIHSNSYDQLFRGATASQNYFSSQQQQLNAVQSSFGDPNSGINAQFTAFQAAINQLVAQGSSGQSTSVNANVLTQAQAMANSLNAAAATVTQQEAQVVQQASSTVTTVNGILDQIATLNGQIRAATAAGDSPNTYEDQRDYNIDQLSQYLSTQTSIQADGSALVTVNGQALVNDTVVYHLSTPVIGTATNGAPTFKIDFASNPPAAASAAGVPLGSGQLAAMADLYNNKLSVYGNQLDQFASSLANEVNRVTTSAYTVNGQLGSALFQPIVATLPITAANIKSGITDPSQLPTALASTAAGTLVVPLNSANNSIDTSSVIDGNASFANPPAADAGPVGGTNGTLTVSVDGVSQTFDYQTNGNVAGANASSIDQFLTSFNAGHYGVTASFDAGSQRIVFARDPSNEDLVLRAKQGNSAETPDFTVADAPNAGGGAGLLSALGASGINNVPQNAGNAFGASSSGAANALVALFSSNVGVPALQFSSGAGVTATAATPITVAVPPNSFYSNKISVGQVLTIDAQPGGAAPQENVAVTAVSYANGVESITFTPANNHAANFSITSAQTQTLGQFYGSFITQVGLDAQTAATGTTTQTTLANNINTVRQGIAGINIDEETQNLIKYQSAYTAAAQTINVLNQILQTTITSLGVGQ